MNERKLYSKGKVNPLQTQLLELWLQNGYELGNHTFSHMNYHKSSFEAFTNDIIKGEKITKPLSQKYNLPYVYFRHPYLRLGATKGAHDSLNVFLAEHDYIEAPVSIDNDDYLFAKAYFVAFKRKDTELMQKIGKDYVRLYGSQGGTL